MNEILEEGKLTHPIVLQLRNTPAGDQVVLTVTEEYLQ
jgi:hypothetical protein